MTRHTQNKKSKKFTPKKDKLHAILESIATLTLSLLSIASIFFFIIPNINQTFELKKDIDKLTQEVTALNKKLDEINSYSIEDLNTLYEKTLQFIPENINVGSMGASINQMATNSNLEIQRLTLKEEPQNRNLKLQNSIKTSLVLPLKSITAPFIMLGQKQDLLQFLDTLTNSLEAREFDTVQLIHIEDKWMLKLELTHLYMSYIKEVPISSTLPNLNKSLLSRLEEQLETMNNQNTENTSIKQTAKTASNKE